MTYKLSELRTKEIIHIADGERLGFVSDAEIDYETGKILSVIVSGTYKAFGILGKEPDKVIPWTKIKKIGEDLIIID